MRSATSRAYSGKQELLALAALYGLYELTRGVRRVDFSTATEHAAHIVRFERSLGVFSEQAVQRFCEGIPALAHTLAILYPTLHVFGTLGVLVWVYGTRRSAYAFVRTTLVLMTALALVVYVLYPVAPPRLAIAGFVDTVSERGPFDLSSALLGRFYNPVAAVPSLHFGYALLMGAAIAWLAGPSAVRIAGALYPVVALFVIVATGNHYYFDAATGAVVALAAALAARALAGDVAAPRLSLPSASDAQSVVPSASASAGTTGTRASISPVATRSSPTSRGRETQRSDDAHRAPCGRPLPRLSAPPRRQGAASPSIGAAASHRAQPHIGQRSGRRLRMTR